MTPFPSMSSMISMSMTIIMIISMSMFMPMAFSMTMSLIMIFIFSSWTIYFTSYFPNNTSHFIFFILNTGFNLKQNIFKICFCLFFCYFLHFLFYFCPTQLHPPLNLSKCEHLKLYSYYIHQS